MEPATEATQTAVPSINASQQNTLTPEELPTALLKGQHKEIYARFSQTLKEAISEEDLAATAEGFIEGIESLALSTTLFHNGTEQRTWLSNTGNKGMMAIFDPEGVILGIQVLELASSPQTDAKLTKVEYALPFEGDWLVFWGGTNVFENYHYEYESQRYAYDFIQAKDNYSYTGDPLKNESYYAFGKTIYAPADGTVVSVVNEIADNEPVGVMNPKQPAGNVVVIDHGGEYSYLAHLKQGSATVKAGDQVKQGDVIGLTGNSGNSSEPHLHFQVSDGADLFAAKSINILWEGKLKPVQGETVTPIAP